MPRKKINQTIDLADTRKKQGVYNNKISDSPTKKVNYGHVNGLNQINLSAMQRNMLFFTIAGCIGHAVAAQLAHINPRKSAITYDGSRRLSKKEIETLVNEKVTLNPQLIGNKAAEIKCEQIKKNIIETANHPGFTGDHFFRPLTNPNFKAECTNNLFLDNREVESITPGRFFMILEKLLFNVNVDKSDIPEVASHEFIHADHFHLKNDKNSPCKVADDEGLVPFYPITNDVMKKYTYALNLGIARAKMAKEIFIKQIQGMKLTAKEQKLYNQYHAVLEECWGLKDSIETRVITQQEHQYIKNLFAQNNGNPVLVPKNDGSQRLALDVYAKKNNRYYITYQATSTSMAVIEHLATIEEILKYSYSGETELVEISEKEAFVLQDLTDAARNLIVPEVMALRNDYIARCTKKESTEETRKLELRR